MFPALGVKYDAEKEQKAEWEAKQKELQRIEEAKKAEAEKGRLVTSRGRVCETVFIERDRYQNTDS